MRLTRIGGPTVLVELGGWRVLIDPTFDPPGRRYPFALGTSSTKLLGPSASIADLGVIDVVLLSHDHHSDNLDGAGRQMLPTAGRVITTRRGAARLTLPHAVGLRAGECTEVEHAEREALIISATPARHGPPLSRPVVGDVVGFTVRRRSHAREELWITGDTVLTRRLRKLARSMQCDVAIVNTGGVKFPVTGPLTYTMTGRDAVRLVADLCPLVAIPAHYDGWSHFRDGEEGTRSAVKDARFAVRSKFRWLPDGQPMDLSEQLNTQPFTQERPTS